jgi:transglutaminase-like putative cysteine protease
MVLFTGIIFWLDRVVGLETSPWHLALAANLGIVLGTRWYTLQVASRGMITGAVLTGIVGIMVIRLLQYLPVVPGLPSLYYFYRGSHIEFQLWVLILAAISTILLLRHQVMITVELLLLVTSFIAALASHRNYHLDSPKFIASIAWDLHLEYLTTLLIVSAVFFAALVFYLAVLGVSSTSDTAAVALGERPSHLQQGLRIGSIAVLFLVMGLLGSSLYSRFSTEIGSREANGVGEATNKEGTSSLNFHSSIGGSSQPTAMVRLDADYTQNPFKNLLYLRESALSQLGDANMVTAAIEYDQDIIRTPPSRPFVREGLSDLPNRIELPHSIYLLATIGATFAADYPVSTKPLKNPDPHRFKGAYKAVSMAPAFPIESLNEEEVGDPTWNDQQRFHYTQFHPDHRYGELARRIIGGEQNPAKKAGMVMQWLTKHAIYTLTPNHEELPGSDPVAPFLFGDMRGYCVHFAHATVYMLRSLGIPSRIGTGYLSDLAQARDGHVLLRMSDRHAWAEVYFKNLGWVPFDTFPEQVESAADPKVDMQTLEELMGLLDLKDEVLPQSDVADEKGLEEPPGQWPAPNPRVFLLPILLVLLGLLILKFYLRLGWITARDPKNRLRLSYRAYISKLWDQGIRRQDGETRLEFEQRILPHEPAQSSRLLRPLLETLYGRSSADDLRPSKIDSWRAEDLSSAGNVPFRRKLKAMSSLSSALAFFRGDLR